MVATKRNCAMKLYQLVRKNCNGSTYVVVDDVVGIFLEAMCNVILIREDDFKSLPKYLEGTAHKMKVLDESGFEVANPKFRDSLMGEFENRGQQNSKLHLELKDWKKEVGKVASTKVKKEEIG